MQFTRLKVGLFGIGLDVYWDQFEGLKSRLLGYMQQVHGRLEGSDADIVNLGLIDTVDQAMEAGHRFRQADVDIIFLYVTTYALSATVLPVVQRAKVPVIVLNLAPGASIDYAYFNGLRNRHDMTGEWLAYCSACPVPELANALIRSGIRFEQVTGVLDETDECWVEVAEWVEAAKVAHAMGHNRLGAMGTYYSGMLDIYTDITLQLATFGGHIEHLEVDELSAFARQLRQDRSVSALQISGRRLTYGPIAVPMSWRVLPAHPWRSTNWWLLINWGRSLTITKDAVSWKTKIR